MSVHLYRQLKKHIDLYVNCKQGFVLKFQNSEGFMLADLPFLLLFKAAVHLAQQQNTTWVQASC